MRLYALCESCAFCLSKCLLHPSPHPHCLICVCVCPTFTFSSRVCTAGAVIVKAVAYMCFRNVHIHPGTFQGPHTFQHPQWNPFNYLRQSPWRSKFAGDEWNDSDAWFGKAYIQPWSFQIDGQITVFNAQSPGKSCFYRGLSLPTHVPCVDHVPWNQRENHAWDEWSNSDVCFWKVLIQHCTFQNPHTSQCISLCCACTMKTLFLGSRNVPEMDQMVQNQMCALGKHTVSHGPFRTHTLLNTSPCVLRIQWAPSETWSKHMKG